MRVVHSLRSRSCVRSRYGSSVKVLGSGTSGTVELHRQPNGGDVYAIKTLQDRESYESGKEFEQRVLSEYHVLSGLSHENVVAVHGCVVSLPKRHTVYLAMEYVPQTLESVVDAMATDQLLPIWDQIVTALLYLHSQNIAHRDLKFANIGLKGSTVKLLDFGSATAGTDKSYGMCGSERFQAPEVYAQMGYAPLPTDVWSLGVILFYFHNKRFPWKSARKGDKDFNMFLEGGAVQDGCALGERTESCLTVNPDDRPPITQVQLHNSALQA